MMGAPVKQPLEIRFLGMAPSEAIEAAARDRAAKLEQFCDRLMACRVTIERLHKHRQHGQPHTVRIDVTLPRRELSVDRVQDEDVHVALRDAFDDMTRRIEDTVRRVRGQQKVHAASQAAAEGRQARGVGLGKHRVG